MNIPTNLEVISKTVKQHIVNFTFNITGEILTSLSNLNFMCLHRIRIKYPLNCLGPDHIGIILSPYKGVHLEKWSIFDEKPVQGPMWNDRETYFIYYACASNCVPYTFSIELNVSWQDKSSLFHRIM